MIADRELAEHLVARMRACTGLLNDTIIEVQQRCTEEELAAYRLAVGHVMGEVLSQVLQPLRARHPDLMPEIFDRPVDDPGAPGKG
jgi:hypothetical protein